MIAESNLLIAGAKFAMDAYFQFKGTQDVETKAEVTINRILISKQGVAMNISVINISNKPFSILHTFIEQKGIKFDACRIVEIGKQGYYQGNLGFTFIGDTFNIKYDNPDNDAFSLETFNIHAYLLENQAETGWIIFKMRPENLVINKFGIKLSVSKEILYAT